MSSLPNSKSSFLRATQGCGALALAGAMVLPMTPALAQNAAPVADAPAANAVTPKPAAQDAAAQPTYSADYDGILYTGEGGTVTLKGAGFTKQWREQHGTVVFYIAATKDRPGNAEPSTSMLRFEEGKDFTIADDGTFEAKLTIKAKALESFYTPIDYFPGITLDEVRYETGILTEAKGQPQSSIEDIWARKNVIAHHPMYTRAYHPQVLAPKWKYDALKDTTKDQELLIQGEGFVGEELPGREGAMYVIREKGSNTPVLATSDIIEFDHPTQASAYRDGNLYGNVHLPANTLDASKKYVIEVWANDGYSETGELLAPVVGKSTEGRGTLLAWQDLDLNGTNGYREANLPNAQDPKKDDNQKPAPSDEKLKTPATRGELAAALYIQAGTPEVKLPETSPWPDVKTDDPNFPAYVWARQKGITFGWSDGKFHADAGISNATVAAFAYRAAGSPAVTGNSPYSDVAPGSAFYREILWAQQNKVVLNASGAFDAQHMVTHGELETLIEAFQARAK